MELPRGQRIKQIPVKLGAVRRELAQPVYRGSARAYSLDEEIESFCPEAVVSDVHGGPAAG